MALSEVLKCHLNDAYFGSDINVPVKLIKCDNTYINMQF